MYSLHSTSMTILRSVKQLLEGGREGGRETHDLDSLRKRTMHTSNAISVIHNVAGPMVGGTGGEVPQALDVILETSTHFASQR